MADVQLENGYTRIANELLEAFGMYNFTGSEYAMLWLILRLSYGCGKKTATFRNWADASVVGIERQKCKPILRGLIDTDVIWVDWDIKTIALNKNYETWQVPKKDIVDNKRLKDLVLFNTKCNLQVTNVTPELHQKSTKCNPQVTQMSPPGYIDVTPRLHENAANPHGNKPQAPPKESKEIKDNIYIYNKQESCHSSDLLSRLEFLPGIIDISRTQDKAYFDYISQFPEEKIGVVLAEAQRRTGLDTKNGERLQRKSVLKFIAGGLENYDKLYKHRKLTSEQKLADAERVYDSILNDDTADKSDPTYIAALEQAKEQVERLKEV